MALKSSFMVQTFSIHRKRPKPDRPELRSTERGAPKKAQAMAAQTAMANAADVFCVLGQLGSGIQNNDMRNAASAMRQSCGYGDEIRARQQAQYADLARRGAAIASRINRLKGE